MKTFLKIIALTMTLMAVTPTFAHVHFGIGINIGPPPLRHEIIYERPYADAIWAPGYYNRVGYRYDWVPGYWRRPAYFRGGESWHHERFEHRDWDRDRHEGSREGFAHREGRIR